MKVELGGDYYIMDETWGFSLVHMVPVAEKKGRGSGPPKMDAEGNVVTKEEKAYYGTIYQTLQAYVNKSVDNAMGIPDIVTDVQEAMAVINEVMDEIKKKFRTEVLVSGRQERRESEGVTQ